MTAQKRKDVFLFSSARTLSNLLCHMLSAQPGWEQASYHFHDAFLHAIMAIRNGGLQAITPEFKVDVDKRLAEGFQNMLTDMEKAHTQGKPIFIKGHAKQLWHPLSRPDGKPGATPASAACLDHDKDAAKRNPTMLPDDMMLSWIPVFIIRNPILIAQSWYRAETRVGPLDLSDDNILPNLSSNYPRAIFDWYMNLPEAQRTTPIVIDADDLVEGDRAISELCRRCGMDEKSVLYEWEAQELKPDMEARHKSYIEGLYKSKGVDKSKSSKGITMDGQHKIWCDEFGQDSADILRQFAQDNMDNYVYMKGFKI